MAADYLDAVFKALADRHRRRILDLLREEGGQPLVRLCAQLDGMSRQAVAKHVAVLEAAVSWSARAAAACPT